VPSAQDNIPRLDLLLNFLIKDSAFTFDARDDRIQRRKRTIYVGNEENFLSDFFISE